jgi:hypothetical protein
MVRSHGSAVLERILEGGFNLDTEWYVIRLVSAAAPPPQSPPR